MLRSPWSRPLTSQGFSLPPAFALRISSRIATCSCTASSQVLPPRAKDADTDLTSSGPVIAPAEVEAPFPFSRPGAGLAAKNEVIWPRLGGDAGDDVRAFLGDEDAPQDRGDDARTDPMRLGPGGPASSSSAAAAAFASSWRQRHSTPTTPGPRPQSIAQYIHVRLIQLKPVLPLVSD